MPGNVVLTCSLAFSYIYMLIISISLSSVFLHLLFVCPLSVSFQVPWDFLQPCPSTLKHQQPQILM